jgi:signal transduction histidine kinase
MTTKAEKEGFLRLLMVEENETKRIASELHHDVAQFLGMVQRDLQKGIRQIKDNQVKSGIESLDTVIPKIKEAIDRIQKIGFCLWPPTLENAHLGLLATISWFCREYQKAHSNIRIDVQIDIQEDEVHDFLKPVIYKILREALNKTEYGKAAVVHVFLRRRDLAIELTIQDDGEGFDLEKEGSMDSKLGLSLDSMKERTEIAGGSFSIESAIGKGMVLRASWPL